MILTASASSIIANAVAINFLLLYSFVIFSVYSTAFVKIANIAIIAPVEVTNCGTLNVDSLETDNVRIPIAPAIATNFPVETDDVNFSNESLRLSNRSDILSFSPLTFSLLPDPNKFWIISNSGFILLYTPTNIEAAPPVNIPANMSPRVTFSLTQSITFRILSNILVNISEIFMFFNEFNPLFIAVLIELKMEIALLPTSPAIFDSHSNKLFNTFASDSATCVNLLVGVTASFAFLAHSEMTFIPSPRTAITGFSVFKNEPAIFPNDWITFITIDAALNIPNAMSCA